MRLLIFVSLLIYFQPHQTYAQGLPSAACAAFASNGALATGTIRFGKLEIKLNETTSGIVTAHAAIPNQKACEQSFSSDGRWLATLVRGDIPNIIVIDRKSNQVFRQIPLSTHRMPYLPETAPDVLPHLAGFLPDDSLAYWNFAPTYSDDHRSRPINVWHLQRWNMEGDLVSDQPLGTDSLGLIPFATPSLNRFWVPGTCNSCYYSFTQNGSNLIHANSLTLPENSSSAPAPVPAKDEFLDVVGEMDAQKAVLLDYSGKEISSVNLPFFPNLLFPLAADGFSAQKAQLSTDSKIAAISCSRWAWVFVDTDRDWGSEVILLTTNPLHHIATYKTGQATSRPLQSTTATIRSASLATGKITGTTYGGMKVAQVNGNL